MTGGRPRAARLVALLLSAVAFERSARGDGDPASSQPERDADVAAPRLERVAVSVATGGPCPSSLRDVVAGQLADVTSDLVWTCRDRSDPEDVFRPEGPHGSAARVLVDLRAGGEARLTVGDARSDRFVVRRVPLANGLDELGREQIGQILRFAMIALRARDGRTLSRTEARAAVADWSAPSRPVDALRAGPARRGPQLAIDVGAIWSLRALAPEIPAAHELALAVVIGGVASSLAGSVEAGYRLPASHSAEPVGVRLSAASLRLGISVGQSRMRVVSFSAGAGLGLERVWFAPIGAAASVAPAAADAFWTGTGRFMIAVALRVRPTLVVGARVACDVAAADVHYDLYDASGVPHRVLTERRVAPSVGLGIAWRP